MSPTFLAFLVILWFERSKTKYCYTPKIKHFAPPTSWLATLLPSPLHHLSFPFGQQTRFHCMQPGGVSRSDGARGKKQVWCPVFEPEVFQEQLCCIEESACDVVGTFRHPGHCVPSAGPCVQHVPVGVKVRRSALSKSRRSHAFSFDFTFVSLTSTRKLGSMRQS